MGPFNFNLPTLGIIVSFSDAIVGEVGTAVSAADIAKDGKTKPSEGGKHERTSVISSVATEPDLTHQQLRNVKTQKTTWKTTKSRKLRKNK